MAAGSNMSGETPVVAAPSAQSAPNETAVNTNTIDDATYNGVSVVVATKYPNCKSELKMHDIADMLSNLKLNPLAEEFFPSYVNDRNRDQFEMSFFVPDNKNSGIEGFPNNRRRRNNYTQGRRRLNGRAYRAQREDSIRRTVYVSDIDHNVTEEQLAALFSGYGQGEFCVICQGELPL